MFCVPEKAGAKPDVLRVDGQSNGLPAFHLSSLKSSYAEQAMREINADIDVIAYVVQFAPSTIVSILRRGIAGKSKC